MELRQGILGIIDASLNYFDSNSSSLSESAKNHIGKKSQDAKSELEEKKKLLQSLETQLANLEEERIRIENESDRIRLKKTEAVYYNNIHTNQLFNLQKKIFELETGSF
jgi:predicted  nucleic acid-binding Zn-ribbon protein